MTVAREVSLTPALSRQERGKLPVLQTSSAGRPSRLERPPWLKVRLNTTGEYEEVRGMMRRLSLVTVCEEARCPNIHECWARERTATFMLMGDVCTRTCGFCAVGKGRPGSLDSEEPERVAQAAAELSLSHAVVTSVNRDDLEDGGAAHFASTIRAIRRRLRDCTVEVLIPDFCGNWDALALVLAERPEILNHNTETVPRLYHRVRPQARYERSLELLARADVYRRESSPTSAGFRSRSTTRRRSSTFSGERARPWGSSTWNRLLSSAPPITPAEPWTERELEPHNLERKPENE